MRVAPSGTKTFQHQVQGAAGVGGTGCAVRPAGKQQRPSEGTTQPLRRGRLTSVNLLSRAVVTLWSVRITSAREGWGREVLFFVNVIALSTCKWAHRGPGVLRPQEACRG